MPKPINSFLQELKALKKNVKGNDLLTQSVDKLIKHCDKNKEYDDITFLNKDLSTAGYTRKDDEKKKQMIAAAFIERVILLNQLQEASGNMLDPEVKDHVDQVVQNNTLSEDEIKMLQNYENELAEKQVDDMSTLDTEMKEINKINGAISEIDIKECPPGTDPAQFQKDTAEDFADAKKLVADQIAKALAVKTIGRTIKSYQAADETMTVEERKELEKDMYGEDGANIEVAANDIKTRDDFQRMMSDVKSWKDLKIMTQEVQGVGNRIFKRLADTAKTMINEQAIQENAPERASTLEHHMEHQMT